MLAEVVAVCAPRSGKWEKFMSARTDTDKRTGETARLGFICMQGLGRREGGSEGEAEPVPGEHRSCHGDRANLRAAGSRTMAARRVAWQYFPGARMHEAGELAESVDLERV